MASFASLRPWLACALFVGLSGVAHGRTWTNHQGKQIEADYVRLEGLNVVLRMNGREVSVPLANLSDVDKQYVFQRVAGVPEQPPTSTDAADANNAPNDKQKSDRQDDEEDAHDSSTGLSNLRRADVADGVARIRNWTDKQGNSIRAKFIRIHEGQVVLMQGRKTVTCPIAELSTSDQEFLSAFLEARGESHLMPSLAQLAAQPNINEAPMPGAIAGAGHAQAPPPTAITGGGSGPAGPTFPPPFTPPPFRSEPMTYPGHAAAPVAGVGMHGSPTATIPSHDIAASHTSHSGSGVGSYPGHAGGPTTMAPSHTVATIPSAPGSHDMSSMAPLDGAPSTPMLGPDVAYNPPPPIQTQTQVVEYYCSNCGKNVPEHIDDRCPHCGVYFDYVEQPGGSRKYNGLRWKGGIGTIIAVVIGVVVRLIMGAQRR